MMFNVSGCLSPEFATPFSPKLCELFVGYDIFNSRLSSSDLTKVKFSETFPAQNKEGGFRGFKLCCHSNVVDFHGKNKGKKKVYGGTLPSILRALRADDDLEKTLDMHFEKLSPKEQTVILKEQRGWERVLRIFEWFKRQKDYVPSVIHYNIVLRALGRAQRWDGLRLCWIDMAKNRVLPTNNTYGMLVDVYGKSGLVKEALLWIKHMKLRGIFPDEVTMSTVVKVLKDAGEFDRADRFYKDWCNGRIGLEDQDLDNLEDQQAISLKQFLSTELFRSGGRLYSSEYLENEDRTMRTPRLTSTYNTLIDLYGKAGRLKDAAEVFAAMLKAGVELDIFTFNTMIFICGSNGSLSEAEALLHEMEGRGISPDTKTYNIFISLYADAGNINTALECYRKIRKTGLFPDDVTYRTTLRILCERNMVQEVEDVIREIEKLGNRVDESSLPVLAKMYVNEGMYERAKLLIDKRVFSSKTLAAIMDVYGEKGLWAEAEALFFSKRDECGHDVSVYNVMIKAYGKGKEYQKAVSLFRGMRNRGAWPDECTYNSLIQMLSGGDLVDKARDLLSEMREAGFKPSYPTFTSVIGSLAKEKRLVEAVDLFNEMMSADVRPNEVVYGILINAFAEDENIEEAKKYLRTMEENGISPNHIILTSMIKAYGKIGSVEGAKQMYEKSKKLVDCPDIVASNSMISMYGELGMITEAEAIYDELTQKKLADGATFGAMMYVYKNMGMLDEAVDVANKMKTSGLLVDTVSYNKVMTCYASSGLLIECGELLHEMVVKKVLPDIGTFKVLFTVLKKSDFPAEAVKKLQYSFREGKPFSKQAVITSVYSVLGLHSYALESCGIFKKEDLYTSTNAHAYNAAIRAYAAYGKIDEALNMFMRMQDEGLEADIVTLINLVKCYGKAGIVEGVKRIHSQMKCGEIERDECLYKAIIDAYRDANRHDLGELASQEMRFSSDGLQQFTDSETEDPPAEG